MTAAPSRKSTCSPKPGEVDQLLPVGAQAVEVEVLSLPAEVVVGVFVPLQDGTEGPAGLHRCLQLTQGVVREQGHGDVVEQPLAQRLRVAREQHNRQIRHPVKETRKSRKK